MQILNIVFIFLNRLIEKKNYYNEKHNIVFDELKVVKPIAISYCNYLFCCNKFIFKIIKNPLFQQKVIVT